MGEEKPQYPYPPPPNYPPPQQVIQPVQGAAGSGTGSVKSFFPITNSERFFRV